LGADEEFLRADPFEGEHGEGFGYFAASDGGCVLDYVEEVVGIEEADLL
jgi:hypothetical protein